MHRHGNRVLDHHHLRGDTCAEEASNIGARATSELLSHPEISDVLFSADAAGRFSVCGVFVARDGVEATADAARVASVVFGSALGDGTTPVPVEITAQPLEFAAEDAEFLVR